MNFMVGDIVRINEKYPYPRWRGTEHVVTGVELTPDVANGGGGFVVTGERPLGVWFEFVEKVGTTEDAVNHPSYYVMPDGTETVNVTKWLSGAGAQAVQYIVRSTRIDGTVKDNPIEDIDKAIFWLNVERDRLGGDSAKQE